MLFPLHKSFDDFYQLRRPINFGRGEAVALKDLSERPALAENFLDHPLHHRMGGMVKAERRCQGEMKTAVLWIAERPLEMRNQGLMLRPREIGCDVWCDGTA